MVKEVVLEEAISPKLEAASATARVLTLAKGAGISLVGKVLGRGLHMAGQIVLARLLGPEAFGLYAIGWTILRVAQSVLPLGLDSGVIQFASRYQQTEFSRIREVIARSFYLAFSSGIFFGGGLFLVAPWLAVEVFKKPSLVLVLRVFALSFPLIAGLRVVSAATRVSLRMKFSVYSEDIGQPLANLVFICLAYLLGTRLGGAVVAGAASFAISFGLALYYLRNLFGKVFSSALGKSVVSYRELLAFALPTTMVATFNALTVWVDGLLVGFFLSASETGIYQAASQTSVLFAIVMTAFNAIFAPLIAQLYHKKELTQLNELFRVSTKWGLYLSLPFYIVFCLAPKELLAVIFGAQYISGALPFVILTTAQLVNLGAGSVGFMLIMTGRQNRWAWISGSAFLVNFVLNLVLTPRFGLLGASLGLSVALVWLVIMGLIQVKRSLGLWPYDRRYVKGFLAALAATAATFSVRLAGLNLTWLNLLMMLVISISFFWGFLLLFGLDQEDHEFMAVMLAHLKSRFQMPFQV